MSGPTAAKYIWLDRLGEVDRQYRLARAAVAALLRAVEDGRVTLTGTERPRALRTLLGDGGTAGVLERTFHVRLFAVFEEACRRCWTEFVGSDRDRIDVRALLPRLQAHSRGRIDAATLAAADAVRAVRNGLVHGGAAAGRVSLAGAKKSLGDFLAGLPDRWVTP